MCFVREDLCSYWNSGAYFLYACRNAFGSDGLLQIPFSDYQLAEQICSAALIFIMFYGGFNLKWKAARTIAVKATCLSTLGVLLTVIFSMVCMHLFMGLDWITGF